jgi:hypothetical protein
MPFCKISAMILRFEIRGCFMPCAWDSLFCTLCKRLEMACLAKRIPEASRAEGEAVSVADLVRKGTADRRGGEAFLAELDCQPVGIGVPPGELGGGAEDQFGLERFVRKNFR